MAVGSVQVAFGNNPFDASPTWTTLTGVISWDTTRGRQYELDKTQTGTATVTIKDTTGKYDPSNPTGPFYGQILPLKQIRIVAANPVTNATATVFRGFVENWDYATDLTQALQTVTITCVDGFDVLANREVQPDSTGQATYAVQDVQGRILAALQDAGWLLPLPKIFSGNVTVQGVTYQAGTNLLSVIQDAADAEFPGVANFYIARDGQPTFHGRYARFNPANYANLGIKTWNAGDAQAALGNAGWARIADLKWELGLRHLINACLCTPEGIAMSQVAAQLPTSPTSMATFGKRVQKIEGLLTLNGTTTGNNANQECLLFANYYVNNYSNPQPRISQLVFKAMDPLDANNAATWALMYGVEIGDLIYVTTHAPGNGGFQQVGFFVEGIHNQVTPGNERFPQWTMTLDTSPQALYTNAPPGGAAPAQQPAPVDISFIGPGQHPLR